MVLFRTLDKLLPGLFVETDLQHRRHAISECRTPNVATLPIQQPFDIDISVFGLATLPSDESDLDSRLKSRS